MSKSDKAFRTITEAAEMLGVPAHVLRFWESKFKYIKPMKRGGGRRYYRPEDLSILRGIKHLLYKDGLTIKGAQKVIQTNGVKAIANLVESKSSSEPSQIQKSKKIPSLTRIKPVFWPPSISLDQEKLIRQIPVEKLANIMDQITKVRDSVKNRLRKKVTA